MKKKKNSKTEEINFFTQKGAEQGTPFLYNPDAPAPVHFNNFETFFFS